MENSYFAYCCNVCALYFEIKEHGKTKAKREAKTVGKTSNYDQNDPRPYASIIS